MTKFAKLKPRFDKKLANDGVWFYPDDEVGNDYGGFKLGLFNAAVPRVKVLVERAQRTANNKRGSEMDRIREGIEQFVEACLVDWDQKDEAGKAIPFDRETAIEYFMTTEPGEDGKPVFVYDYAYSECYAFVRDTTQFQSRDQVKAGDPEGN